MRNDIIYVKGQIMQRDTRLFAQHDKIAVTGLYLRVDNKKVMLIIFSLENSLVSVCYSGYSHKNKHKNPYLSCCQGF